MSEPLGLVTTEEDPTDHIGDPIPGDQLDPALITHLAELEDDLAGDPDNTEGSTEPAGDAR